MKSLLWFAALALLCGCAHERADLSYEEPLTSPGAKFAKLSPAAQNTVRAQAGTAEIADIRDDTTLGKGVYEIDFLNPALYPPLFVANDGSVLTSNMTVAVGASPDSIASSAGGAVGGLRLDDLPPNVVKTIHATAPTGEVGSIQKITSGTFIFYEVGFKDALNPGLLIADDGTLVKRLR